MKTLDEQYAYGYHGALFTVETAEDAWRLGTLEQFLAPSIRQRLDGYRRLIDSCDDRIQLAGDALAMSRAAADYARFARSCSSTPRSTAKSRRGEFGTVAPWPCGSARVSSSARR
jgi:hypothetical protein